MADQKHQERPLNGFQRTILGPFTKGNTSRFSTVYCQSKKYKLHQKQENLINREKKAVNRTYNH